jgi:hypothetical protein
VIALAMALLLQAATPPVKSGDPIPGVPNTATEAAKPKHDTVKNAVGNVKAVVAEPVPCTPSPCKAASASDPIPGVDDARPTPQKPKFP